MPTDTVAQITHLKSDIAALCQSLTLPGLPEVALVVIREQLAEKEAALARLTGVPIISSVTAQRDVNIATNQTILNLAIAIYGADPGQERREQLARYLDRLAAKLSHLPLRGIDERLDHGDGIALHHVYVMLATQSRVDITRGTEEAVKVYFVDEKVRRELKPEFDPRTALPDRAILGYTAATNNEFYTLARAKLATEALADSLRLVLCGEPGGGKSTFVRYLAWALAEQSLGRQAPALAGWPAERLALPVFLPMRALSGALERDGVRDDVVFAALRETISSYGVHNTNELLSQSLDTGNALLLLDGLDEVPLDAVPGSTVGRATALAALKSFARTHRRTTILLTTRTRAFDDQSRIALGWPVDVLAPLTLGQMRFFVKAWYAELAAAGQLAPDLEVILGEELITAIERGRHLAELGRTPLLLTLMALVLYNKGALPRDRPQLYERVLELLLGQWDKVREGQSLSETLSLTDWNADRFRPLLDRLSYEAHRTAQSGDGRGRLVRSAVRDALVDFFEKAGFREERAMALAGSCLDYFNQRSGLLVPDDADDSYAFVHLTLQEYCAGRFIVTQKNPIDLILEHHADDRWREPIMLGLGAIQTASPFLIESVIRRLSGIVHSERTQQQRDLILAAEIGADRDWAVLREQGIDVDGLKATLRAGLVELLAECVAPLSVTERLRAGQLLGAINDPRFPVDLDDWRRELGRRNELFGIAGDNYWHYVMPGTYRIGGWGKGESSANLTLAPFWVAHLPITVAQYALFVAEGYSANAKQWWLSESWQWKQRQGIMSPTYWGHVGYSGMNQPVVMMTWHEATAYCAWLTDHLTNVLPTDYMLRLPTEAEWEVAAAYDAFGQRRTYPWGEAMPDQERAIYDTAMLQSPASVGCCPAGAAACGALDIAGNVWELAISEYRAYPAKSHTAQKDLTKGHIAWRGGSCHQDSSYVRCGARVTDSLDGGRGGFHGFRVVLAPRLNH
ncbi:MAG: SUMF1/EgtB/PvdO family nonheme iron enzyme [Chloroflexales bacterium]